MPTFTMLARSLGRKASAPAPSWAGQASDLGTFSKTAAINKQLTASSAGGLSLTYSAITKPSWLTVSSTGLVTGTATWNNIGLTTSTYSDNTLQVRATDTQGQYTNSPALNLRVTSPLPIWNTTSSLGSVNTNTSFGYTLSAYSDSTVSFQIYSNPGFGYISGSALYGSSPASAGTYYWGIYAIDQEQQYTSYSVYLTVNVPASAGMLLSVVQDSLLSLGYMNRLPITTNRNTTSLIMNSGYSLIAQKSGQLQCNPQRWSTCVSGEDKNGIWLLYVNGSSRGGFGYSQSTANTIFTNVNTNDVIDVYYQPTVACGSQYGSYVGNGSFLQMYGEVTGFTRTYIYMYL